jgi:hypothetical protein
MLEFGVWRVHEVSIGRDGGCCIGPSAVNMAYLLPGIRGCSDSSHERMATCPNCAAARQYARSDYYPARRRLGALKRVEGPGDLQHAQHLTRCASIVMVPPR